MRKTLLVMVALLSLSALALAEDTARKPQYEQDFQAGGGLKLDLSSAGYTIRGTEDKKIRVWVEADPDKLKDVRFSTATAGANGKLKITGPHNNVHYTIELPSHVDLTIRLAAGDLELSGIEGSKDIEMHAGDMNLHVGNVSSYGAVDLSVNVGDLNAGPWSVAKSGLIRSFHQNGAGRYKLHAHIGAGDLNVIAGE